ncbi:MAG: PEP/pyruvate-binding domain-containing protein [Candidatus Micrarchaeia archaeon]
MNIQTKKELFVVHGGEKTSAHMGGKAYNLFNGHEHLLRADFQLMVRQILSIPFVNEFLQRCGASDAWAKGATYVEMCALIDKGKFSRGELAVFELICRAFGDEPALAVRSSAHGDAKGTGAYKSFFFMNRLDSVEYFVKEVIKSHYSSDAVRFRANTGFPDGIAIMVEPLVAEKVFTTLGSAYAPRLSGLAQTYSLWGDTVPTVTAFQGLADLKDMDAGLAVEVFDRLTTIRELIYGCNSAQRFIYDTANERDLSPKSFFLGARLLLENNTIVTALPIWNHKVDFYHTSLTMDKLYCSLEKYMQITGTAEDLEWALRAENEKPVFFINQVSVKDSFHLSIDTSMINGKVLAYSAFVQGSGDDDAPVIVHIFDKEGWERISKINRVHRHFILLIDSDVLGKSWGGELVYSLKSLSHVKAIGFTNKSNHDWLQSGEIFIDTKFGHNLGLLEASGKYIAAFGEFDWDTIAGKRMEEDGYAIYNVHTTFLCSQHDNRALLFVDE